MSAEAGKAFHLSLRVGDLARSVEFYGRLFGMAPAKHYPDYAKFEVAEPPLVLSLEPAKSGDRVGLDHLGLRMTDRAALLDAATGIAERGIDYQHLQGVNCCYARQSKIFSNDPDGHLVEVYTVEADLADDATARSSMAESPAATPAAEGKFDHLLPSAFPLPLPVAAGSLTEINLRGTFNAMVDAETALQIVAECRRALAPGGKVVTHILAADRPVKGDVPRLPEPASHVRRVPTEGDVLGLFEELGYVGIELKRLSHASVFDCGGAQCREFLLTATAPTVVDLSRDEGRTVVYRGPFPAITDDLGNRYERGRRAAVTADAAALLRSGPYADHFVFLTDARSC